MTRLPCASAVSSVSTEPSWESTLCLRHSASQMTRTSTWLKSLPTPSRLSVASWTTESSSTTRLSRRSRLARTRARSKKHVLRFLDAGNKVKITIMFRGREMAHPEQGLSILERLADDLKDVAVVENQPKMEGRNMHMLIAPLPNAAKKKKENDKKAEGKDE